MRSAHEILFRTRQEIANLYLALARPTCGPAAGDALPLRGLPDASSVAARLRDSDYAIGVERLAAEVLEHRFPLLGTTIQAGAEIGWRRDYLHGVESGLHYFRRISYLDCKRSGDHKLVWELNRHQHLVLLAQAHLLTGCEHYLAELLRQWESWCAANPYQRGINWASALEVAFRLLSWIWVYHFIGTRMPPAVRSRFLNELYRHGLHLEFNLSYYFSPNTHLLGEAVALHALGSLFPEFPRAERWRQTGARTVQHELDRQILPDGAHFERSSYYHLYALDFFLLHYILAGRPHAFCKPLQRMAEYLHALLGPDGTLPFIGDDDGGRLFHPYGGHDRYARATLATFAALFREPAFLFSREDLYEQAAWFLGPEALDFRGSTVAPAPSHLFADSGTARMHSPGFVVLADAGGFGPFGAGHSHADTLSLIAWHADEEILIDPGTFTYVADPQRRDWFRGTSAHNTVCVDGADQATRRGPFGWASKPAVAVQDWTSNADWDYLDACCAYPGESIRHRRRVLFLKPNLVLVLDDLTGPAGGERLIEQFWHLGGTPVRLSGNSFQIGSNVRILLDPRAAVSCETGGRHGWRSRALAHIEPAPVLVAGHRSRMPVSLVTLLAAGTARQPETVTLSGDGIIVIQSAERRVLQARFASTGRPQWEYDATS